MKIFLRATLLVIINNVPVAQALIGDILNIVFGPILNLVAQPVCNVLLENIPVQFTFIDTNSCDCSGRFDGLQVVGMVSCAAEQRFCGFNQVWCGDLSVDMTVRPAIFGNWKFDGVATWENLDFTQSGVAERYRTIIAQGRLEDGFSFNLEEVKFSIGGESCRAVICDEVVSFANLFRRVLVDCSKVDLSGDSNPNAVAIPGPAFLPSCPLAT